MAIDRFENLTDTKLINVRNRTKRRIEKFDTGKGGDQPHIDRLRSKLRKFDREIERRNASTTSVKTTSKKLVDA